MATARAPSRPRLWMVLALLVSITLAGAWFALRRFLPGVLDLPAARRARAPSSAQAPSPIRLAPASFSRPVALEKDTMLFLPFLNRTARRPHPADLRSLDQTLGAFAAAFLGSRIVAPERAAQAASEIGFPGPFEAGSSLVPDGAALDRAASATGAGVGPTGPPGARGATRREASPWEQRSRRCTAHAPEPAHRPVTRPSRSGSGQWMRPPRPVRP